VHGMRGTDPELHNNPTCAQPSTYFSTQDRTAPKCLVFAGIAINYMDRDDPDILSSRIKISLLRRKLAVPLLGSDALHRFVLSALVDASVRLHQH